MSNNILGFVQILFTKGFIRQIFRIQQEPIENMTENTASSGVMQATEEATTPIEPKISEEENGNTQEEKDISEKEKNFLSI